MMHTMQQMMYAMQQMMLDTISYIVYWGETLLIWEQLTIDLTHFDGLYAEKLAYKVRASKTEHCQLMNLPIFMYFRSQ